MANCELKLIGKNGESTTIVDLPANSENMQLEELVGFLQSSPEALQRIDKFLNQNEEFELKDLKIPDKLKDLKGNYLGNYTLNGFLKQNKDIELTPRAKELIDIVQQTFPKTNIILRQNRPLVRENGGNAIRGMVARMQQENPLVIITGDDNDAINNTLVHELTHLCYNKLIEESPEIKRNLKLLYDVLKTHSSPDIKRVMAAIRNSGGINNETEIFAYLFSDNSIWNFMQDKEAAPERVINLFNKITSLLNSPEPTSNVLVDIKNDEEIEDAEILEDKLAPFAFSDIPLEESKKFGSGTPYEFLEKNIDNPMTVWSESVIVNNELQLTKLKFGDVIQTPLFMYLGWDNGKGAIFGPAFKYNRSLPINQIFSMINENAKLSDEDYAAKINAHAKDKITPTQARKLKEKQAKYKEKNEKYLNYKQNHIIDSVWYWDDGNTFMAKVPHKFKNGNIAKFYIPLNPDNVISYKSLHPDFIQKWTEDGVKIDTFTDLDMDSITQDELTYAENALESLLNDDKNEVLLKTIDTKFGKLEESTELGFKISGNYGDLSEEMQNAALGDYIKVTTKFGGKGKKNEAEWMIKVSNLAGGIVVMDKNKELKTVNSNKVTSVIYNKENNPAFVEEITNLANSAAGFRGQQRKRIQEELFKNKAITIYPFDKVKDDENNSKPKEEILEKMASNLKKGDLVNVRLNIKEGEKYKPVDAIFSVLKVSGKYVTVIGTSDKKQSLRIDITKQPEFSWHKNKNDQWEYGTYNQRKGTVTPGQETGKAFILQGFKDNSENLELQQFFNDYKDNIQNYYSKDYTGDRSWSQDENLINETDAVSQMLGEILDPNNKFQNLSLDSQWQRTSFENYNENLKLSKIANLQKGDFVKSEFSFEKNGKVITGSKIAIVEKVDTKTGKINVLVETKAGRISNQTVDFNDITEVGERMLPITYLDVNGPVYFNTTNTEFIAENLGISKEDVEKNLKVISEGHSEIREDLKKSFESWIHEDRNFFTVSTNVEDTEDFDDVQRNLISRFGGKNNFNNWFQFIETIEVVNTETGEVKRIKKDSKIPNGWIENESAEKLSWVKRKNGSYIKKYHMDLQNMYEVGKLNFNDAQKFIRKGDIITFEYNKGNKPQYIQGRVTESAQGKSGVIQITLLKRDKSGMLTTKRINWSNSIGTESMRIVEAFTKDKERAKAMNSFIKNNENLELNPLYTSKNKVSKSIESPKLKKSRDSAESIGYMAQNISNLYGIKASVFTNEEMINLGNSHKVDLSNVRAFYLDGEMFINQDKASIAEPLHEITHAILPGLKSKNPRLYEVMMEKVKEHPIYSKVAEEYDTLSNDDLDNEVFCTIFGEYYRKTMLDQGWNDWIDEDFLNFVNNTSEVVGEIFEIDNVDKSTADLMKMSINDIMKTFGSALVRGEFKSYINFDTTISSTQRLKNLKEKLLEKGLIKKYCIKG